MLYRIDGVPRRIVGRQVPQFYLRHPDDPERRLRLAIQEKIYIANADVRQNCDSGAEVGRQAGPGTKGPELLSIRRFPNRQSGESEEEDAPPKGFQAAEAALHQLCKISENRRKAVSNQQNPDHRQVLPLHHLPKDFPKEFNFQIARQKFFLLVLPI